MIPNYIREMRLSDRDELYAIVTASLDEEYLPDVFYAFSESWPEGQFVSCDFSGRPLGLICSARLADGGVRIMLFAVSPGCRGCGIGTKLLERTLMQARMEMRRYVTLEVRKENMRARAFYSRFGFRESDPLEGYYNDRGDGVRMMLFLS